MEGNNKYILYARKSTDDVERQILSISAQVTEVKEFATKTGLEVVDILTESKTAKEPGRPIFNAMMDRISSGEVTGILAWHPDRLARNAVDAGRIIHLLDTGKLLDLKFPHVWFQNTPQGMLMLNMVFGQSKYFVDSLSENTKRGQREKIRNGIFPGCAPLGYLNDKNTKTIVPDPNEAEIVKELFALYSKGIYTFESMSQFLFTKGIRARGGKPFHKSVTKMILTNPFYYGHFRYGGEVHEGKHSPLVSKKLWDKCQEIMVGRCWPHKVNHKYPFTGLMRCGECGYMITAENKIKHYKKHNRTQIFTYYRCTKKNPNQKCYQPFVRESVIVNALRARIKSFALPHGWAQWFLEEIKKEEQLQKSQTGIFVKDKEKERLEVDGKITKLLDVHLDGTISREEFLKKKGQLLAKKKDLEEEIFNKEFAKNSWLEPLRRYTLLTLEAQNLPTTKDYHHDWQDFLKRSGSDLTLKNGKVGGGWLKLRPLTRQRPPSRNVVPGLRFGRRCIGSEPIILPLDDPGKFGNLVYYSPMTLRNLADPVRAKNLARFFKTGEGEYGEGDKFLGITVPQIRAVVKQNKDADVSVLIKSRYHEERLCALLILVEQFKNDQDRVYKFYLANTKYVNNWDLVDLTAPKIVGGYLVSRDKKILYKLARSENLWERRIAILSTFAFIARGESKEALKISEMLLGDSHDLIHKAVGWALREVGKRCGQKIEEEFLQKHYAKIPRTALRYAIERFGEKLRKSYLAWETNLAR